MYILFNPQFFNFDILVTVPTYISISSHLGTLIILWMFVQHL